MLIATGTHFFSTFIFNSSQYNHKVMEELNQKILKLYNKKNSSKQENKVVSEKIGGTPFT